MKHLTLNLHCKCCSRPLRPFVIPTNERQLVDIATIASLESVGDWTPEEIVDILGWTPWVRFCKEIGLQSYACLRGQNLLLRVEEMHFPQ